MQVGDLVEKVGGDYIFVGHIRAIFPKASGAERMVVEDDRGVLHIYSSKNLRPAPATPPRPSDAEIEETVRKAVEALAPVKAGVFYDNGDMTISPPRLLTADIERAFWAHRRAAVLLERLGGRG